MNTSWKSLCSKFQEELLSRAIKVLLIIVVFGFYYNQEVASQEVNYPFLVGPVYVSKNSETKTSSELKSEAINDYTISAFRILVERITTSKYHKELLSLDFEKINVFLQSMLVRDEKIGQSFYQAKLSFAFNQKSLEEFFSSQQIEYYPLPKTNILVVTDGKLFNKNQQYFWQTNWRILSENQSLVGFSTVSPRIVFTTLKQNILDSLAANNLSTYQKINNLNLTKYLVFIKPDKLTNSILTTQLSIFDGLKIQKIVTSQNFNPSSDQNQMIMNKVVNFEQIIRDYLIRQNIKNYNVSGKLVFQISFDNLNTWNHVYEKLEQIKNIYEIFPININYNLAKIEIHYRGSFENLYKSLEKNNLMLRQSGENWLMFSKL